MYGCIIGDVAGSLFTETPLALGDSPSFTESAHFTGNTVLAVATADGLMKTKEGTPPEEVILIVQDSILNWCARYPDAGYSPEFKAWLGSDRGTPFNAPEIFTSTRGAAAGWLYDDISKATLAGTISAGATSVSEGCIRSAQAVAAAVNMGRHGYSKNDILNYFKRNFGYDQIDLGDTAGAIQAFLAGSNFEDVLAFALRLEDADRTTTAAAACAMAEAIYGVPLRLISEVKKSLPQDMLHVIDQLIARATVSRADASDKVEDLEGNEILAETIEGFSRAPMDIRCLENVLNAIMVQLTRHRSLLVPVEHVDIPSSLPEFMFAGELLREERDPEITPAVMTDMDGRKWFTAYTDRRGFDNSTSELYEYGLDGLFELIEESDSIEGLIINAGGSTFHLTRGLAGCVRTTSCSLTWLVPKGDEPRVNFRWEISKLYKDNIRQFEGNEKLVEAMKDFRGKKDSESYQKVLRILFDQMHKRKCFFMPVKNDADIERLYDPHTFSAEILREALFTMKRVTKGGERRFVPVFTDHEQYCSGSYGDILPKVVMVPILTLIYYMRSVKDLDLVINPWDSSMFYLNNELVDSLF